MKKLSSFLIIVSMIFSTIYTTNAAINIDTHSALNSISTLDSNIHTSNDAKKIVILTGAKLADTIKGQKYKTAIDTFTKAATREKLQHIQKRAHYVLSNSSHSDEIHTLVEYLYAKTTLQLLLETEAVTTPEKTVISNIQPLTNTEKAAANKAIILLQKHIYTGMEDITKNIGATLKNTTNVSEKGAFEMDIEADYDRFGYMKYNIEAKNYESHQNGLDSKTKTGTMNILLNVKNPKQEEIKLDLITDIESIQKEGDMYMLLKKLNIYEQKGLGDMNIFIEKAKKLVDENKYIKISNLSQQQMYNFFKNTSSKAFMKDFNLLNTTSIFDIKGKKDNKYILEPNKNFCMFVNNLPMTERVDCDVDFPEIVTDINQAGTIYLAIQQDGNYSISYEGTENSTRIYFLASYSKKELSGLELDIIPNIQDSKLHFEYKKDNNITFTFKDTQAENVIINIQALLKKGNEITSANAKIKTENTDIVANYTDSHLSISLNAKSMFHTIIGKTELDFQNSIPINGNIQLKTIYESENSEKKIGFEFNIDIQNRNISGTTNIPKVIQITHSGKIDRNILSLNNSINFGEEFEAWFNGTTAKKTRDTSRISNISTISEILISYKTDYGTYPTLDEFLTTKDNYFYMWNTTKEGYIKDPKGNIEIDNCQFGYIYELNKEKTTYKLSSCLENEDQKHITGDFSDSFVAENTYNLSGYNNWEKIDNTTKVTDLKGTLDIDIDTRRNKNNIIIDGIFTNNNDTILSIFAKNISTREYNTSVDIQTPTKVIEMQEFIKDFYNY